MNGKPPRGYTPFLVGLTLDAPKGWGRQLWCVATPFEQYADALCDPVHLEDGEAIPLHIFTGDWYAARTRILRLFEKREEAVHAAWIHAKRWWGGGEPLDVPAIPTYPELPTGYAIFIDVDQREVWLSHPDGSHTGEFSGVSVSAGLDAYRTQALRECLEGTRK